MDSSKQKYQNIRGGIIQAVPVVLGYIPVGFAFGVLAVQSGIHWFDAMMMSLLLYAGASQFIAVGLITAGAPILSVIAAVFVVNLRHFIMSSSLAPFLKGWRTLELAAFSYEITDETFVLHANEFHSRGPVKAKALALNVTVHISWLFGTALGVLVGTTASDTRPFALDFALPALFIALLVFQLKSLKQIVAAIGAGLLSIGLAAAGLEHWHIIIAAVIGAALGAAVRK